MKTTGEDWTLLWTDTFISAEDCRAMLPHQRVNRFPGVSAFSCKDLLAQNLNRLYNVFPNRYKIFPKTWCLPHDYASITHYGLSYPKKTFIIKPARGAEGRGIYITKNLKMIKPHERMICQVYISRPFLIDGFKFDLRVYALISSIDPMRIYVYNEGLTRFATKKYEEPSSGNMNDRFMHLTNYAVNRRSAFYVHDQKAGTKRSITTLNKWFVKKGFSVKLIWASIDDAIIKTILVALPTLRRYYSECFPHHFATPACFQILGFDMMLDHRLKPYVLEVNHSPSMGTPTALDAELKSALLCDTFRLLNLQNDNRDYIADVGNKLKKLRAHGDRPHRMYNHDEPALDDPKLKAQFARSARKWEQSHLGNYRKIYPNKNIKRYRDILEYLDRLKWPTLHKIPSFAKCSFQENLSKLSGKMDNAKLARRSSEQLEILDTRKRGANIKACQPYFSRQSEHDCTEENDNSSNSEFNRQKMNAYCGGYQLVKTSSLPTWQNDEGLTRSHFVSHSAMDINVLKKYNFIDRITYSKVESKRKMFENCPAEAVGNRSSGSDSSSRGQNYESTESKEDTSKRSTSNS